MPQIINECQCRKLAKVVIGGIEFIGLRCPSCIDQILEEKNRLVAENWQLRNSNQLPQKMEQQ